MARSRPQRPTTESMGLRLGVVTAYPPSSLSLNEFGFHLVKHLSRLEEVAGIEVYADEDAGVSVSGEGDHGITVRRCWRFNSLRTAWSLSRRIASHHVDAVIMNLQFATFGDRRLPGALGLLLPALLKLRSIPSLLILHNLADNVDMQDAGFARSALSARVMKIAGRVLTRCLLRADIVAATIPRYVEFLRESYGARNAVLAPHGSFEEVVVRSFGTPSDSRIVLAFGKWGTYKTVEPLVSAFEELQRRGYTDIKLVLAGGDSPNSPGYIEDARKRYAANAAIEFTGYVAEEAIAELFGSATVVAFPYTSTTGSSGVLHQAGEYGRSVVLPRIGDLIDVIEEEGFQGVYFMPDDPNSLADALAEVLDDPELRMQLGRRNFAAATGIPMSEVVEWHLTHIQNIIERRSHR